MNDYTITAIGDVPDVLGDYPGEMHMLTMGMDSEQVAFTYRRMPPREDTVKHDDFWPA